MNNRIEDISLSVTSGGISDMEDYAQESVKYRCHFALDELKAHVQRQNISMTLIVPEYVLAQREAKAKAEKVQRKSLTERIPQLTGWRILVMPYMGREKTERDLCSRSIKRARGSRYRRICGWVGPLAYQTRISWW